MSAISTEQKMSIEGEVSFYRCPHCNRNQFTGGNRGSLPMLLARDHIYRLKQDGLHLNLNGNHYSVQEAGDYNIRFLGATITVEPRSEEEPSSARILHEFLYTHEETESVVSVCDVTDDN